MSRPRWRAKVRELLREACAETRSAAMILVGKEGQVFECLGRISPELGWRIPDLNDSELRAEIPGFARRLDCPVVASMRLLAIIDDETDRSELAEVLEMLLNRLRAVIASEIEPGDDGNGGESNEASFDAGC